VATLFAGAVLAGGAAAALPAHAEASVDPGVCHDGIVLSDIYRSMGDHRTANDILWNLVAMGCAEN
jgi:hypothetical protein